MPKHLLRKGQIQIGESMLVIIILLFVGVLVLVYAANNAKEKYEVKIAEFEELDTIDTARIVTHLYELKCTKEGLKTTCIDQHKAQSLAHLITTSPEAYDYYYELFKNAKITLQEIYPEEHNYTLYEVNASSDVTVYAQRGKSLIIPVSIHNGSSNKVSFGILTIKRFHQAQGYS